VIFLYDFVDDEHDRSVAVDDTTAVLDSCSLKHRRAYFTEYGRQSIIKEEKREHRMKARTFASSLP